MITEKILRSTFFGTKFQKEHKFEGIVTSKRALKPLLLEIFSPQYALLLATKTVFLRAPKRAHIFKTEKIAIALFFQ